VITPFNNSFFIDKFDITQELIQKGYVVLSKIPNLNTICVNLDESNSILSSAYIVEEVTLENIFLYPGALVGSYVLSWAVTSGSSSSSSNSSTYELELKILLESGLYSFLHVSYISVS
jgi:hypothetical protein